MYVDSPRALASDSSRVQDVMKADLHYRGGLHVCAEITMRSIVHNLLHDIIKEALCDYFRSALLPGTKWK